jgi:acetyl esterase/lipase
VNMNSGNEYVDKCFDVRVTSDVPYATGGINWSTSPTSRTLKLDIYEPVGAPSRSRPALIMAFGGAFHRGSKESDNFPNEGHFNTTVAEYCHKFASRGYVAFCIDYRKVQEDSDPGTTPLVTNPSSIPTNRINVVRNKLGLPSVTTEIMCAGYEAACDDLENAITFVRNNAEQNSVDTSRIAIGGFSAGASLSLSVAYGARMPVSAVVSLSGSMTRDDLGRYVTGDSDTTGLPSVLLVSGEHDLENIREQAPIMGDHFSRADLLYAQHIVPGENHFYSADAIITTSDGNSMTLESIISEFLNERMRVGPTSS